MKFDLHSNFWQTIFGHIEFFVHHGFVTHYCGFTLHPFILVKFIYPCYFLFNFVFILGECFATYAYNKWCILCEGGSLSLCYPPIHCMSLYTWYLPLSIYVHIPIHFPYLSIPHTYSYM